MPKTKVQRPKGPKLRAIGNLPFRLATFTLIVHSAFRLILLSRIDGDAPRAQNELALAFG